MAERMNAMWNGQGVDLLGWNRDLVFAIRTKEIQCSAVY